MKRRDFIKASGAVAIQAVAGLSLPSWLFSNLATAQTATDPISSLKQSLIKETGTSVLVPTDTTFSTFQPAFNLRTMQAPEVRVLCNTATSVSTAIQWAQKNQMPLALRCGGHSYEGFSQTTGLVIDVRQMNSVQKVDTTTDPSNPTVTVGAGASLGQVYSSINGEQFALPAGSCPTVGISGHTLGGGFGLLGRYRGLACDSLVGAQIVTADGNILIVDTQNNSDLFWALRGGGGGSFGVVTQLKFNVYPITQAMAFGINWTVNQAQALSLIKEWQNWASNAPNNITALLNVTKNGPTTGTGSSTYSIHCGGQSVGPEVTLASLNAELQNMLSVVASNSVSVQTLSMTAAIQFFSGSSAYQSIFMKGKSDYINQPMSDAGITTLLSQLGLLPPGEVGLIFDAHGGAVNAIPSSATAFSHRAGTLYSIQYYSQWGSSAMTQQRLSEIRTVYAAMRSFVSGGAYVNYCDIDLPNYAQAYWGANLPQLQQIKAKYDPGNFFKHAQSIPLPS